MIDLPRVGHDLGFGYVIRTRVLALLPLGGLSLRLCEVASNGQALFTMTPVHWKSLLPWRSD